MSSISSESILWSISGKAVSFGSVGGKKKKRQPQLFDRKRYHECSYIFSLASLFWGQGVERLVEVLFVPTCAISPADGFGSGVEIRVASVPL